MSTTNTETYDKYIEHINSIAEEANKITEKYDKELSEKTDKINSDDTLTKEQKEDRIKKLEEKISKNITEKNEKLKKDLEETTEKINKEIGDIETSLKERLEKIAPIVSLLTLPSPTPSEIVKWIGTAKDTVIKEKVEPAPIHTKQIIEIATKVALIASAVAAAISALNSSSSPNITIPSLDLDQATIDILNSIPTDIDGKVETAGFPSNPSLGDLYTDSENITYQWNGSEWVIINLESYLSGKGSVYLQYGTSYLYKWSTVLPNAPIGSSTYDWELEKNTNYSSTDSWSAEVPSAPNTPGVYLWVAYIDISDALVNHYTEINWLNNSSVLIKKADVSLKAEGLKTIVAKIYKWDITIPVAPSSTSTYNWDTKIISDIPVGWDDLTGISPSPGFSLWEASVALFEGEDVEETSINWLHSAIGAIGYAGTQGVSGIQGESGDSIDVIFTRSASQPTTPSDSEGIPDGWVSNISDLTSGSQTDYIWSCFGRKSSTKQNPTVILSNENMSFHSIDSDMFADSSCDVSAYIGSTQLTYGTSGPNTFSIEYLANTNVAVTYTEDIVNAPTEIYDDIAFVDVVVTLRDNLGNVHSSVTRKINYSLIHDEVLPATFNIFNIDQYFTKSYDGTFSPSYIPLNVFQTNIGDSTYQWYKNDTIISGATSSSYSVSTTDFSSVLSNTYKCIVTGTIDNIPNQTREDSVTLYRLDSATDKYIWEEPVRIEGELPVTYNLLCSSYVTSKSVSGSFTPSIIAFSAQQTIGDGLPSNYSGRYKIYLNDSDIATYTSSSDESAKAFIVPTGTTSIKAELYFEGGTSIKLDEASVAVVNDGGTVLVVLSNESHSIPCDKDGNPLSYVSSGTDIYVIENGTYLDYVTSISGNGQFTVSADGTGITSGSITDGTIPNRAVVGVHSAMTTNPAKITYTITAKNSQGITSTITKIQTLSKAITGATGSSGLSIAELSIYKRSATAPTTPTGGSYDFGSTTVTPPSGWTSTIPSGTDPVYVSRTVATITGSTGSDSTLTWSTPVISFQNGDIGVSGSSYRACYARIPNNPTPVAGTATTLGNTSFPISSTTTSTNVTNWGLGAITWAASDTNPSSTYTLYVCDGIYSPSTGNTIWTTPYQASLKVGTLSAITANLGTVNTGLMKNADFDTNGGMKIDLDGSNIAVGDPVDGDYCRLSNGDVQFYRYIAGEHRMTKSLKRVEFFAAQNNVNVTIPGYWKSPPFIMVSPYMLSVYKAAYTNVDQKLVCQATNISETSSGSGQYYFKPVATLELSSGSYGQIINNTKTQSSLTFGSVEGRPSYYGTLYWDSITTPTNVSSITVTGSYSADSTDNTIPYENAPYCWPNWPVDTRFTIYLTVDGVDYVIYNHQVFDTFQESNAVAGNFSKTVSVTSGSHSLSLKVVVDKIQVNYSYVPPGCPNGYINVTFGSYSTNISSASVLAEGSLNCIAIGE